jgi:hypothetical protein
MTGEESRPAFVQPRALAKKRKNFRAVRREAPLTRDIHAGNHCNAVIRTRRRISTGYLYCCA